MSPAIFPVVLQDPAGSFSCMHGGKFKQSSSYSAVTFNGKEPVKNNAPLTVVTPCPGVPPSIPPCQFTTPVQTMTTRVTINGSLIPANEMMPQLSASNGQPMIIASSKTTTVKVL